MPLNVEEKEYPKEMCNFKVAECYWLMRDKEPESQQLLLSLWSLYHKQTNEERPRDAVEKLSYTSPIHPHLSHPF